jgi:hypothetical protein
MAVCGAFLVVSLASRCDIQAQETLPGGNAAMVEHGVKAYRRATARVQPQGIRDIDEPSGAA